MRLGVTLGWRWTAIESVGLYVPGGTASYPSSVLMNAVPAKVAGVPRIVMVVPTPRGETNPLVLAAARLAGVDEIYRIGGAQAVAALAYGTAIGAAGGQDRRPRQCLCRGRQAAGLRPGRHRHDRRPLRSAGPRRPPRQSDWIAADLLAQAEHDTAAQAILITDERGARRRGRGGGRAPAADAAAGRDRRRRAGAISARSSWSPDLETAIPLVDRLAPEHLEIEAAERRGARRARSAMPARSSSAAIRRKRSAIMSAGPTTCCRRRARPASPPASACSTS